MDGRMPAVNAELDQELEDRLSGTSVNDPTEEEGRETDPDYEAWLDQRAAELEEDRYETAGFAAEQW